jgi:serine/threonine protein kinase
MILLAGKYRIERVIGHGGMGVVVAAVHTALDERVAIKLLLPEALASADTVARFQREARAAVRIKSEHVARVIDVGSVDAAALPMQAALGVPVVVGAPFMVMECLDGQDLAGVLRTAGPLSLVDTATYVGQAIEAIAEAHALGIVHRDLKPSNLFLTRRPDGTPLIKVLDFGISKTATPGGDAAVTTTSAVLGSPMYMAPEQMIASREVDGRTDVWALGVVVYQLLTGRGPFAGTTMAELCARILQEPHAPVRQTRPDVPGEIDAIVARCLEKDRTRRYPSVADLAEALAPFGGASTAMSAERARRLIPRTERAVVENVHAFGATALAATPFAATDASWSATQGRPTSSSAVWVSLIVVVTAVVLGVGIALFVVASRMQHTASARSVSAPPEPTARERAAATSDPVELIPLQVSTTATPQKTNLPNRRTPPATTTQPTQAAPPQPTSTSPPPPPKPDIF